MIDREELLEKYAGTEKDFTGRRRGGLRDKTIRGGIYRESDLSGRYFDASAFREADLSFANFSCIRMYETSFKNCYMEGIDFTGARFGQVGFKNVDLTRAIFKNATLGETSFKNVNLSYADFSGARRFNEGNYINLIFYQTIMPDGSIRTDAPSK